MVKVPRTPKLGRSAKLDQFLLEAIDRMFHMSGLGGFDPKFCKNRNWRSMGSWSSKKLNQFRDWFLETAKDRMGWSEKVARQELAYFEMTQCWLDVPMEDGGEVESAAGVSVV
jgi:hypothetical protein